MIEWTSTGRTRLVKSYGADTIAMRPGERVRSVLQIFESGEHRTLTVIEHNAVRELGDMLASLASGALDRAVRKWAPKGDGAGGA